MQLIQIRRQQWAVYDDNGRVVIITSSRKIAEGFLNGGQYSVHKITIGARETFANGQVSQLGQLVVYVKLYR